MEMTRDSNLPEHIAMPIDCLPEFWREQPQRVVARRVWIPWPIAILLAPLFWFMPKRTGPHFAAAGWLAAIVAHAIWLYYGIGWIALSGELASRHFMYENMRVGTGPGLDARWPAPTLSEILRAPLAVIPCDLGLGGDTSMILAVAAGMTISIGVIVLVVSILLMPYVTAGERLKWVFGRSLRLTWWSSTGLVVLGLSINVLYRFHYVSEDCVLTVVGLFILWMVTLPIRASLRYAGRPEGAEWQKIGPQCDRCGYGLTALPPQAVCPECGLLVTESFPERRCASPWGAAQGFLHSPVAYLRTCGAVLRGRDFFRRLRIHGEHPAAAKFAVWTCVLASLLLAIPVVILINWADSYPPHGFDPMVLKDWYHAGFAWGLIGTLFLGFLGFVVLLWSGFGYRPLQRYATVTFYWSAWVLPVTVTAVGAILLIWWLFRQSFFRWIVTFPQAGQVNLYDCLCMLPAAVPVGLAIHAIVRLNRGLRETQYANA